MQSIKRNTIVLLEGVFLFRPAIRPFLDVKLFVDVTLDQVMERVVVRDLKVLGSSENIRERYLKKYIPGQRLYFADVHPQIHADICIDNNDVLPLSI